MPLSEKTLELNVTHELLSNADLLWTLMGHSLGATQPFPHAPSFPQRSSRWLRPPFALGLSLVEENRAGWDVKIVPPPSWPAPHRALFLQFKKGYPRQYSLGGLFKGSRARHKRKPHILFEINNNSTKDQHVLLRKIAGNPHMSKAVLYALPRIPHVHALQQWVGRLAPHTTWITVVDVDGMAKANNNSIVRGSPHELAVSFDDKQRELRSEAVDISELADQSAGVVSEIVATRVWRSISLWRDTLIEADRFPLLAEINWRTMWHAFMLNFALYWGVEPERAVRSLRDVVRLTDADEDAMRLVVGREEDIQREVLQADELPEDLQTRWLESDRTRRAAVFDAVVKAVTPYVRATASPRDIERRLPVPATEFSVGVDEEGLGVLREAGDWAATLRGISYQLL